MSEVNITHLGAFLLGQQLRRNLAAVRTVSGVWVFNDSLSFYDENNTAYYSEEVQSVNFTSGSAEYSSMTVRLSDSGVTWIIKYDESFVYNQFENFYDSTHATIDFGTTPQAVTEAFYKWITVNAVKQ